MASVGRDMRAINGYGVRPSSTRANSRRLVSASEVERTLVHSLGDWSAGPEPLYRQLSEALRAALNREIPAGTILPPERRLAQFLMISRTTVVAAYGILRADGLVESRRGSGTRVVPPALATSPAEPLKLATARTFRSIIERDRASLDIGTATLGAEDVITSAIQSHAAEQLASLTATAGYYPYGLPALRAAIARRLTDGGLPAVESEILVTNGAQQAIRLLAELLVEPHSSVVVENPTYAGALDAFAVARARVRGIPVEEQQGSLELLRRVQRREHPRVLYLMPTFQNPTGAVSTLARRQQLAAFAAEHQMYLIEDDTLAPLAISRTPPPPIAGFDGQGRVITVGSLSKTVWGGLRIGWIRAAPRIIDRVVRLKTVADLGTSLPSQTLAVAILEDFERIAALRARQLDQCLALTCRRLEERLPDWTFDRPSGGYSIWIRLPDADAESFAQLALRHGVIVIPGPLLSPDRSFRDHIRLQFFQPDEVIEQGINALAGAWAEYTAAVTRHLRVVV